MTLVSSPVVSQSLSIKGCHDPLNVIQQQDTIIIHSFWITKPDPNMRAVYLLSTLLAATALASAVPQEPAENAELAPIEESTGIPSWLH